MPAKAKTKVGSRICTEYVDQLRESHFYRVDFLPRFIECLNELGDDRRIAQIVCYGLGSFYDSVSVAPRYQLALLLLISETVREFGCQNLDDTIDIYDPKFKDRDLAILRSFERPKFHIIEQNENCARKLEVTTLVFMPHLYKRLYNNLIGANWHPDSLRRVVLVGNSFQEMIDATFLSKLKSLHYIHLLVSNFNIESRKTSLKRPNGKLSANGTEEEPHKALVELSLDTSDEEFRFSFSNQSVHFVNDQWLSDNKDRIKSSRIPKWQPEAVSAEEE